MGRLNLQMRPTADFSFIGAFRNSQNDVILAHGHIVGRQRIGRLH